MERNVDFTNKTIEFSKNIGIDVIGFADPKLYDRFSEKNRPEYYLKGSETVIIIGIHLYDIILDAWSQDINTGRSFHYLDSILENYCNLLKEFLNENGYESKIIPYSPGFYLKDSAALAGIGPIGKNNLLITKEFGSQVRLRALTTIASLKTGTPITKSEYCKECEICINACPANALSEGKYKKLLCLPYNLTNLRKLSDYTSIWCNICIEACPISKKTAQSKL
jgi:epoxyqueuosine reductase QueG